MNGPYAYEFYEAMETKMESLEEIQSWDIVPRESVRDSTILDTTWAYIAKRSPDGKIRKYKARICVGGDQQ